MSRFSNYIEAARESSELFIDSVASCYSKKTILIGVMIFLISFSVFATLTPNALLNGDVVVYAQQIGNFDFSRITVHLGYYLLGAVFTGVLQSSSDYTLNLMNCLFGALSLSLLYLMTLAVCKKHTPAVISSLFLGTNFVFLKNALYAEVYMPQTFFLLLAFQLWLFNKPFLTGLSLALSTLVTPTSILAVPCFIILRPSKRSLFRFGATALIILAVALLPHYQDYLFGGRGLQRASGSAINMGSAILKELREVGYGFFLYTPFVLLGMLQFVREKELRVFGVATLTLWLFIFLFAERFPDVPVQLPTYVLLCLAAGLGFHLSSTTLKKVTKRGRINHLLVAFGVLALIISISGFRAFTLISRKSHDLVEYRNTVREISEIASPDYLVVGKFRERLLFLHYSFPELDAEGRTRAGWLSTPWIPARHLLKGAEGGPQQVASIDRWQHAITSGREIWILENCPPLFSELQKGGYTIERFRKVYRATKRPD